MTRMIRAIAVLSLGALACGDAEPRPDTDADTTAGASDRAPAGEAGLPVDSVDFQATGDATSDLSGTLWLSTSLPEDADGVSLIAQLEGVPPEQAYSWAIHRGGCDQPDDVILPLGYGTEAGEGSHRSTQGGPLGETRAAFEPTLDGRVEETVWVPLDGELSRAQLEGAVHSLRIHPAAGGDELDPSVACAPVPGVPNGD